MERALQSLIDWYDRAGVDVPDLPPNRPVRRIRPKAKPRTETAPSPQRPAAATPNLAPTAPIAAGCNTLDGLKAALDVYDAGPLSDGARQAVFSRGNPAANLMVIGEAPGRDEDREGKPFVGRSGQLLDRMLAAIGLSSETDVFISNVCFWRPENNRKPDPAELELCRPFVHRAIELAEPKVILLTGGAPMQSLLGMTGIMKNRGQWNVISVGGRDIPTLPIYHPAFLLRQPALKKDAWQDLLALREKLAE